MRSVEIGVGDRPCQVSGDGRGLRAYDPQPAKPLVGPIRMRRVGPRFQERLEFVGGLGVAHGAPRGVPGLNPLVGLGGDRRRLEQAVQHGLAGQVNPGTVVLVKSGEVLDGGSQGPRGVARGDHVRRVHGGGRPIELSLEQGLVADLGRQGRATGVGDARSHGSLGEIVDRVSVGPPLSGVDDPLRIHDVRASGRGEQRRE